MAVWKEIKAALNSHLGLTAMIPLNDIFVCGFVKVIARAGTRCTFYNTVTGESKSITFVKNTTFKKLSKDLSDEIRYIILPLEIGKWRVTKEFDGQSGSVNVSITEIGKIVDCPMVATSKELYKKDVAGSYSYNVPDVHYAIAVIAVGAGASGEYSNGGSFNKNGGDGGGGGQCTEKTVYDLPLNGSGRNLSITVGKGGKLVYSSKGTNLEHAPGGNTVVGSLVTANGGKTKAKGGAGAGDGGSGNSGSSYGEGRPGGNGRFGKGGADSGLDGGGGGSYGNGGSANKTKPTYGGGGAGLNQLESDAFNSAQFSNTGADGLVIIYECI